MRTALETAGMETRFWYGFGLHHDPYFAGAARDFLPNTGAMAPRLVGLPTAADLPVESVEAIVALIEQTLRKLAETDVRRFGQACAD